MGAGTGQGVASRWGGQRHPLSRLSEVWLAHWKAGKLAVECTNERGCSPTFHTRTMFSLFLLPE